MMRLAALALTALVPGGAHLFALPNKIGLDRDTYFAVQGIYAGWALFAAPIFGAILANSALWLLERRRDPASARAALAAALLIVLTLVVFFVWVFPGNQATANWTEAPANWEALRRRWEYGHAASALLTFAALLATGRAIIGTRTGPR